MTPRVLAALLAVLGGVLLVVAGGLAFLAQESRGWHGAMAVVGYAATLAALALMGYGLVERAPVWLRIIVSVAVPLLLASVWQVVDQAIDDRFAGWKGPAFSHLLAGAIVLVTGLVALRRGTADRASGYAPTHHR
jgi:hypothetical protein